MKEFFTIHEVARLYGICPDTLRYYEEQGLLHPKRSAGNYRLYRIADICNLNVIRGLRALDMPVERMRRYFDDCTLASTLSLLDEEEQTIDARIAGLQKARRTLCERRDKLTRAAGHEVGVLHLRALEARACLRLSERGIREPEVDWALRRLALRHEGLVKLLGSQTMGAVLDTECLRAGVFDRYESVFFLGCGKKDADDIIPAGRYACLFYKGAYSQLPAACAALFAALRAQGLAARGPVMELYHIDAHDTASEDEFLTELQVRTAGEEEQKK